MFDGKRIPLAWSVRWHRIRQRVIPAVSFVLAVWLSGLLWNHRGGAVHGVGEVEARRIDVTSPVSAIVTAFEKADGSSWRTFDRVEAGELLARLSPLPVANDQPQPETIDIHAPLTGSIVAIKSASGQVVTPGSVLATIADDKASHIISYLPENSRYEVEPGLPVVLRSRSFSEKRVVTRIEAVGRQIERVPSHHASGSAMPEWGLPVRIQIPASASFLPGSLVDVVFSKSAKKN